MTHLKISGYLSSVYVLLSVVMLGCLSLAAQNVVRVDSGIVESHELSESGAGTIQKWILPEKRSISRMEIHFDPIEPLRNTTIYAKTREDSWRIITSIKTPIRTSPYTLRAAFTTDTIRIVMGSSTGLIRQIVLYGIEPE